MKKRAKYLFFILFLHSFVFFNSCVEPDYEFFEATSFAIKSFDRYNLVAIKDSSDIKYNDYCINLLFETSEYKSKTANIIYQANSLFAEDFPPPPIIKNYVTNVEITSNRDFDENHPAGTILNNLFLPKIITTYQNYNNDIDEHTAYSERNKTLEDVFNDVFIFRNYVKNYDKDAIDYCILRLGSNSSYKGFLQFIVKLSFEDGTTMADTTGFVRLTN